MAARANSHDVGGAPANPMPTAPPPDGALRIVPLGGLGEFGKNALLLEFGEDAILLDCGQRFPDAEMFGVDSVIPDFAYLMARARRLRAVVLTHGHEDHIGSLPYLARQWAGPLPVYGPRLALALVHEKLLEMGLVRAVQPHEVHGYDRIELGAFALEFIPVAHSFPDSMSLVIDLPIGRVIHTSDFRFDRVGGHTDAIEEAFAGRAREREVLLLLSDSTNIDREGFSSTEQEVRDGLASVIAGHTGSVLVATFASNLFRVESLLQVAEGTGREVTVCGYSLERNVEIATDLGLLHYDRTRLLPLAELKQLPPRRRMIITTGTQGEPLSALSRFALQSYRGYEVGPDDLIVMSSRMIPGNERAIYRMINHFYRRGAHVVTERDARVHGSGHAYRGELRRMLELTRPRYFVPVHGELRQLFSHAELARASGVAEGRVFIVENGMQLDLTPRAAILEPTQWAGQVLVDGRVVDGVHEVVLRDRQHLADDGMLTAILVIDRQSHRIIAGPEVVSRGFVLIDENEALIEECKQVVTETFAACSHESQEEWDVVKTEVRRALRKFLRTRIDRYPMILPVVLEI